MIAELLSVKVSKKSIEAEDIVSFELVHPDGDILPAFTAGSHIDVHMGDKLIRQYSLSNDPAENHRYLLGVLKEVDGSGGSLTMHEQVKEGDLLQISQPRNNFHLLEEAEYSLLLAGGIGVTPILGMAQRLASLGKNFDIHYCTRSRERCAYYDQLKISTFAEKVNIHFDNGPKEQRLDIPALLRDYPEGANVYVCGPAGFMEVVISNAEQHWPSGAVHREYFSADPAAGHDNDCSFEVKIASSGEIYTIPAEQSIVEALLEHDIEILVSCEQGICGTCLTAVIEGEPEHRDMFLSEAEHDANDQMTLCCSRSRSDILVLDL